MYDEIESAFFKIDNILKGTAELTDKFDIETVILALKDMNQKIDFLKELKKRRTQAIDEQISLLEGNVEILQNAIVNCLNSNKEKTLDFPGVGKVQVRNTKGTWQINDAAALKEYIEKSQRSSVDFIDYTWKFNKKEVNKLLNKLEENNNVPAYVTKEPDRQSLSLSFSKEEPVSVPPTNSVPVTTQTQDFDKLVI